MFVSVWHLNPKFKVANEALEELGEAERVGLLGEEADSEIYVPKWEHDASYVFCFWSLFANCQQN